MIIGIVFRVIMKNLNADLGGVICLAVNLGQLVRLLHPLQSA